MCSGFLALLSGAPWAKQTKRGTIPRQFWPKFQLLSKIASQWAAFEESDSRHNCSHLPSPVNAAINWLPEKNPLGLTKEMKKSFCVPLKFWISGQNIFKSNKHAYSFQVQLCLHGPCRKNGARRADDRQRQGSYLEFKMQTNIKEMNKYTTTTKIAP